MWPLSPLTYQMAYFLMSSESVRSYCPFLSAYDIWFPVQFHSKNQLVGEVVKVFASCRPRESQGFKQVRNFADLMHWPKFG